MWTDTESDTVISAHFTSAVPCVFKHLCCVNSSNKPDIEPREVEGHGRSVETNPPITVRKDKKLLHLMWLTSDALLPSSGATPSQAYGLGGPESQNIPCTLNRKRI